MSKNQYCVCYCTDMEGNLDYFLRWLKLCEHLEYDEEHDQLRFVNDQAKFVFGGDVCDKGEGSIRLVRWILRLKQQFPERVIIILGNRDLNKIRFTSELQDDQINMEMLHKLEGPYFVGPQQRVSPKEYLLKLAKKENEAATEDDLEKYNTKPNRVRYMLECTMGSAGDFERRRNELQKLKNQEVSDDEVVQSYIDWVGPDGEMTKFLEAGVLAHFEPAIGTLFLHGGLPTTFGYVPKHHSLIKEVQSWITHLNQWLKDELQDWKKNPVWKKGRENEARPQGPGGDWSARGGNRLIAYVAPESEPTVIYVDMFNSVGNMKYLDPLIRSQLTQQGVRRLVVGHKPHGHCPSVMKEGTFEIIDADTSYSDVKSPDMRGQAASAVIIDPEGVDVRGIVTDGQKIQYRLTPEKSKNGDRFVGRPVPFTDGKKGWWVKAKYQTPSEEPERYILQRAEGFKVEFLDISATELETLFKDQEFSIAVFFRISLSLNNTKYILFYRQRESNRNKGSDPLKAPYCQLDPDRAFCGSLVPFLSQIGIDMKAEVGQVQTLDFSAKNKNYVCVNEHQHIIFHSIRLKWPESQFVQFQEQQKDASTSQLPGQIVLEFLSEKQLGQVTDPYFLLGEAVARRNHKTRRQKQAAREKEEHEKKDQKKRSRAKTSLNV